MAEEPTATAVAEPEVQPVVEPAPAPEPVAAPDPVAELRERNARIEGELAALRAQVSTATRPQPQPQAQWTPELAQQEYEAGRITDAQRVDILARLGARQIVSEYDASQRVRETIVRAGDGLQQYMRAYPALNDPTSPTMRQVAAELAQIIAEEGGRPDDLRLQLRATKSVLGALKPDTASTARQRIPVGGPGAPGGGAPSGPGTKGDPLRDVPADVIAEWKASGAKLDDPAKRQWYANRYYAHRARSGAR